MNSREIWSSDSSWHGNFLILLASPTRLTTNKVGEPKDRKWSTPAHLVNKLASEFLMKGGRWKLSDLFLGPSLWAVGAQATCLGWAACQHLTLSTSWPSQESCFPEESSLLFSLGREGSRNEAFCVLLEPIYSSMGLKDQWESAVAQAGTHQVGGLSLGPRTSTTLLIPLFSVPLHREGKNVACRVSLSGC